MASPAHPIPGAPPGPPLPHPSPEASPSLAADIAGTMSGEESPPGPPPEPPAEEAAAEEQTIPEPEEQPKEAAAEEPPVTGEPPKKEVQPKEPDDAASEDKTSDDELELRFSDEKGGEEETVDPQQPSVSEIEGKAEEDLASAIAKNDGKKIISAYQGTTQGKRVIKSFRALREFTQSAGLTELPDAEQLQAMHLAESDLTEMKQDLESGTEGGAHNFLNHWMIDKTGAPSSGADVLISNLPQFLIANKAMFPLYLKLAAPILADTFEGLYNRAGEESDPHMYQHLVRTAQGLEFEATGKYRPMPETATATSTPTAAVNGSGRTNPREAKLLQEIADKNQEVQRLQQEQTSQYSGEVEASVEAVVQKDLADLLAPLKPLYDEGDFEAVTGRLAAQVHKEIGRDELFRRRFTKAVRDGASSEDIREMYQERARPVIRNVARKKLGGTKRNKTEQAIIESKERHQQLNQAAQRKGPTPGAPKPQLTASKTTERQQGEDLGRSILREVRADLST